MAFANMSGDPEQEHFGDGIAEDIITALSKLRWLFVIARHSSFIYKSRPTDVRRIGRELGVRYILEGSVRKAGNYVRINSQLIDVMTGAHVWAERYDRELIDLFAVQDEITSSVASAIGPALADAERRRVMRKAPESLDAWEAYHRGFWHFLKQEPAENENAKIYFQRAIAIDPNFGSGYCGLALTHLWDAWLYQKRSFPECVNVARPLAQRAITLDDGGAMAHFALALVFANQGDTEGWRGEAERGVGLDPNNAWVLSGLASYYTMQGSAAEALSAIQKMMRASPHDPMTWWWMLWIINANIMTAITRGRLRRHSASFDFDLGCQWHIDGELPHSVNWGGSTKRKMRCKRR